jgi:hypothetical protein
VSGFASWQSTGNAASSISGQRLTTMNAWYYYRRQYPRRIAPCAYPDPVDKGGLRPVRGLGPDARCFASKMPTTQAAGCRFPPRYCEIPSLTVPSEVGITRYSDIAGSAYPLVTTARHTRCPARIVALRTTAHSERGLAITAVRQHTSGTRVSSVRRTVVRGAARSMGRDILRSFRKCQ